MALPTDRNMLAFVAGATGALAVSAALVPTRGAVDNSVAALALACVVVAAGAFGGRRGGVLTGAYAALAFDFLHTVPYGHLKVRNLDDVLAMVLLLTLGAMAGGIADRLSALRDRRSDVGEVRRLMRVAERARLGATSDDLTRQVSDELRDTLHLRTCWFEPAPYAVPLPQIEADGSLSTRAYRWSKDGFQLPLQGAAIPFRVAGELRGRFVLAPSPKAVSMERRVVANAIVDQLGAVLALRAF